MPPASEDNQIPLESPTSELRIGQSTLLPWILLAAIIAGIATLIASGVLVIARSTDSAVGQPLLDSLPQQNAQFQQRMDDTHHKASWNLLAKLLVQCAEIEAKISKSMQQIESEYHRLETTDAGRGIASSPHLLEEYVILRDRIRPYTDSESEAARQAIATYRELCQDAISNSSVTLPADSKTEGAAKELFDNLLRAQQQTENHLAALHALVHTGGEQSAASQTLSEALQRRRGELAQEHIRQIDAAMETDRRRSEQRSLEAELAAEHEYLAAQEKVRIQRAQAKTERVRAILDEARRKLDAEAELARLRAGSGKRTQNQSRKTMPPYYSLPGGEVRPALAFATRQV